MYALSWAKARADEHYKAHTRASEFLARELEISFDLRANWLAFGSPLWETWKFLVRMLENGWGIRANPNTWKVLDTTRAYSIVSICLRGDWRGVSQSILTGLQEIARLREHVCERIAALAASIPPPPFDEGQLDLFATYEGGSNATRVSGGAK